MRLQISMQTNLLYLFLKVNDEEKLKLKEMLQQTLQKFEKLEGELSRRKQEIRGLQQQVDNQNNDEMLLVNMLIRLQSQCEEQIHLLRNISASWIIQRSDVVINKKEILGRGSWGTVWKGKYHGSPVAIKELHAITSENVLLFQREMDVATKCHHPNLLHVMGVTNDQGSPLIITELMDCNLKKFMEGNFPKDLGKTLAVQIAQGLCCLHSKDPPIVHRDIKTDNILLKKDGDAGWKAKVGDYGTAKVFCKYNTPNQGTLIYAAPEAQTKDQQTPMVRKHFTLLRFWCCIACLHVTS